MLELSAQGLIGPPMWPAAEAPRLVILSVDNWVDFRQYLRVVDEPKPKLICMMELSVLTSQL